MLIILHELLVQLSLLSSISSIRLKSLCSTNNRQLFLIIVRLKTRESFEVILEALFVALC